MIPTQQTVVGLRPAATVSNSQILKLQGHGGGSARASDATTQKTAASVTVRAQNKSAAEHRIQTPGSQASWLSFLQETSQCSFGASAFFSTKACTYL